MDNKGRRILYAMDFTLYFFWSLFVGFSAALVSMAFNKSITSRKAAAIVVYLGAPFHFVIVLYIAARFTEYYLGL